MNEITFAKEFDGPLRALAAMEDEAKELEQRRKDAKAELCKAMEANGIKWVDTEYVRITYVEPSVSIGVDWKGFKFEDPKRYEKIAKKYNKETKRSAYIKITTK